jgi:hypothetical protein
MVNVSYSYVLVDGNNLMSSYTKDLKQLASPPPPPHSRINLTRSAYPS